ncbi:MAG: response regulator [Bryobacteraceae bacterium]
MSLRILIVDDSPVMRSFIHRVLDLSGLEYAACLQAGNGREALDVLERERVDIVLSDVNMPEMNGEEFLERLSADERIRGIPVVVISTDSTEHRMARMTELGAKGYVKKPFVPEALREVMERVMEAPNG